MFIQALHLKDFLSFQDVSIELGPVNVLIGANGSGKSNVIEAIDFLRHCPGDLNSFVLNEGGAEQWIRRMGGASIASVSAQCRLPELFEYSISFQSEKRTPRISLEGLNPLINGERSDHPEFIRTDRQFIFQDSSPQNLTNLRPAQAFLSQYRTPSADITSTLARHLESIRIYRTLDTGKRTQLRRGAPVTGADEPQLNESGGNLAYVLHELDNQDRLGLVNEYLEEFAPHYQGVKPRLVNGAWTLQLREAGLDAPTPTERISEGTLNFLCLLAILLDPNPPPLICIDEPEVGLHPDAIALVGKAIQDAESRTQLIIATHSEALVNRFSDRPEAVIVCEKDSTNSTTLKRQDSGALASWLEDFTLGDLWHRGVIGGNRR